MASASRRPTKADVPAILDLARTSLADYQRYQATFWRQAGGSVEQPAAFLDSRLDDRAVIAYLAEGELGLDGFVVASLLPAPPVYAPGGPVALVDDFVVRNPADWDTLGRSLLGAARAAARERGAVLLAVVAGHDDAAKRAMLPSAGFSLASEWHLRRLDRERTVSQDDPGVRPARTDDLPALLDLAERRRVQYQAYQPIFWRNAPDARERQAPFFERALRSGDGVALVHEHLDQVEGFLLGSLVPSPPVFASDQVTCLIDDFCVATPEIWPDIGRSLLQAAADEAKSKGASQIAVIAGHLDTLKRAMLRSAGFAVSSEWWVKG